MRLTAVWLTFIVVLVFSFSVGTSCSAQEVRRDSVLLSRAKAESLFLSNNYDLILGQYDIDRARAGVITARLFDNPEISYENVLYNPSSRKFFQTSSADGQGQFNVQYSQLIKLAGKRNKAIRLATIDVRRSEYEFSDLLRTLRYSLRTSLNNLHFLQQSAKVYSREISSLEQTLSSFRIQLNKGNVAEKEVLRIQSLLYSVRNEQASLLSEIEEKMAEVRIFTGLPAHTEVRVTEPEIQVADIAQHYMQLVDSALSNRPDLKAARAGSEYAALNLQLQKAGAVPDITLSATYDRQGSHVKHYTGLGLSLPLPLFNRNQGAIREAKTEVDANTSLVKQTEMVIRNEVEKAYRSVLRSKEIYSSVPSGFSAGFTRLITEVNANYQKRNISLLEFLDLYNSYRESVLQMNQIQASYLNAQEELNYVTASSLREALK